MSRCLCLRLQVGLLVQGVAQGVAHGVLDHTRGAIHTCTGSVSAANAASKASAALAKLVFTASWPPTQAGGGQRGFRLGGACAGSHIQRILRPLHQRLRAGFYSRPLDGAGPEADGKGGGQEDAAHEDHEGEASADGHVFLIGRIDQRT